MVKKKEVPRVSSYCIDKAERHRDENEVDNSPHLCAVRVHCRVFRMDGE